ncbi:hypothetical protein Scep_026962 [Stephania cephalantha]|uniref:Uncharacterized protein n=1 Tax=Stephania cephalantha TaxID=152367 RepID=A0AAP0ERS0_9MAGN
MHHPSLAALDSTGSNGGASEYSRRRRDGRRRKRRRRERKGRGNIDMLTTTDACRGIFRSPLTSIDAAETPWKWCKVEKAVGFPNPSAYLVID